MRCGGETELPLPLCLPAAARVGSDGTNAVVLGSLVGKGRCKYDGEEVGCGEEEAPQDEWCAKGAHLGSTLDIWSSTCVRCDLFECAGAGDEGSAA